MVFAIEIYKSGHFGLKKISHSNVKYRKIIIIMSQFIIIINRLSTSLGIQKTQLFLYSTTTKITLISPALKPGLHF